MNLENMRFEFKTEFDDLFIKNNFDFLEKAWKHKLHVIEQVQKSKVDSKIPGLNNVLKRK